MNDFIEESRKVLKECEENNNMLSSFYLETSFYLDQMSNLNISEQPKTTEKTKLLLFEISNCLAEVQDYTGSDIKIKSYSTKLELIILKVNKRVTTSLNRYEEWKTQGKNNPSQVQIEMDTQIQKINEDKKTIQTQVQIAQTHFFSDHDDFEKLQEDLLTFHQYLKESLKSSNDLLRRARNLTKTGHPLIRFLSPTHNPMGIIVLLPFLLYAASFLGAWLFASERFRYLTITGQVLSILNMTYFIAKWVKKKYKSDISYPPGTYFMRFARFFYSEKTYKLIFEPIQADLSHEYFTALQQKDEKRGQWIQFRYKLIFIKTMLSVILTEIKDALQIFSAGK